MLHNLGCLTLESSRTNCSASEFFVSRDSKMNVFGVDDGAELSPGGLSLERNLAPGDCVNMPVLPARLAAIKPLQPSGDAKLLANSGKRLKPAAESLALLK